MTQLLQTVILAPGAWKGGSEKHSDTSFPVATGGNRKRIPNCSDLMIYAVKTHFDPPQDGPGSKASALARGLGLRWSLGALALGPKAPKQGSRSYINSRSSASAAVIYNQALT